MQIRIEVVMASVGNTRRRVNVFSFASTTPAGIGPYEEVFLNLRDKAPFETRGALERLIRVNYVEKIGSHWLVELYLIIDRLDVLEVSAQPSSTDIPSFVVPPEQRSFASRTCAIFDIPNKICVVEYLRNGPKMIDFSESLSRESYSITKRQGSYFAMTPIIEANFIKEIDQF